ncbi:MAG TPA: 16S rRNA (cytosine(1402)-N(4))-methyltransferase RsmH [Thermoanaerobaculia bacterium]|nr:16S rRNA (cytosine(1402)-N(4))-methyltransferase RsmH [Thermoanaerobaculia bacterium]
MAGAYDHRPVLLEETLRLLAPERGGLFVDCTVGLGGHARALLERSPSARLLGIDRDPEALEIAGERLAPFGERAALVEGSFDRVDRILAERGEGRVAGMLADLGVSSLQLDRPERGFSFRFDGPLDMRMGPSIGRTAADVVRDSTEAELTRILRDYGEERRARRIAKALVQARTEGPIETTGQLRDAVHRAVGGPRAGPARGGPRIDSATRTFQALRIEVNQELAGLERYLDRSIELLEEDGRFVVISYHSLEDRLVKQALRAAATGDIDPVTGRARAETRLIELLTRKPLRSSEAEIEQNPRSRSARLRAARRL